jgi:hypothetical protein
MKRALTIGILTAASVAVAASALAFGGPGRGFGPGAGERGCVQGMQFERGMGSGYRGYGMGGYQLGQLESLKAALNLTDQQLPAWARYEETVTSQAAARDKLRERMHAATSEERVALRDTMHSFSVESAQTVRAARDALYAELSAEQRATAERYVDRPRFAGRGGPRF